MTAMLFPEVAARAHPVSRVMVEVLRTFDHVKLPEKLAFMYLMHATMRVSPSRNALRQYLTVEFGAVADITEQGDLRQPAALAQTDSDPDHHPSCCVDR
jgi:hypothetical protein